MSDKHMRTIDPTFETDLRPGGLLAPLLDLVKQQENRMLLTFRKNYISIYYRGDSLYKIEKTRSGYTVSFDFNHARYTENYNEFLKSLWALGFCLPRSGKLIDYAAFHNNVISKQISRDCGATPAFWAESHKLLTKLTDDYLDDTSTPVYDYFKHAISKKKANHIERQRQHEIALNNRDYMNGFFVYDIEYEEPAEKGATPNRFDMLALEFEQGCAKRLLFIELKSMRSACTGKSGIKEHTSDVCRYFKDDGKKSTRCVEAHDAMDCISRLMEHEYVSFPTTNNFPVEFIIILTDDAQSYAIPDGCNNIFKLGEPWKLTALDV